jgi:hypothetical protein
MVMTRAARPGQPTAQARGACPLPGRERSLRSTTQLGHVLGGGALLSLHDIELDPLTIGEGLESIALNGGVMNEAILLSVLGRDEAKSL